MKDYFFVNLSIILCKLIFKEMIWLKILHTSDWHLGKNLDGYSRMDEQEIFLQDFVEMVNEHDVDLVIIAGDIYDTPNPPSRAEAMFYATLKQISNNGQRLILVVAGNHDSPDRLAAAAPLAKEHGIIIVGTLRHVVDTGNYGQHSVVASGEGFVEIAINGERAVILVVPYPSEKRLNELLYDYMQATEDQAQSYIDHIAMLFKNLEQNYRDDTINLAVSHLFALGSEGSGSETGIQTLGGSYLIPGSYLPQRAQYIALGHVHKKQIVPDTNKRARYSGAPLQYNKRETQTPKVCFLIEAAAGEECVVTEIAFEVYKPIETWLCDSIDDAIEKCAANADRECWVYLEVKTEKPLLESDIKKIRALKNDIINIFPIFSDQIEVDVAKFEDQTAEELFEAFYFKRKNVAADPEIINLFNSIMEEVENEAH